ncbi:MAG: CvpA family protein [Clostridia bacterium]|nr:CvpA family protein [Clostridia bacterium]
MSLAIDAVILFAAVFIIWAGTSRGFVRSVMGFVSAGASLFAAYAYTPVLAAYIRDKYLIEKIASGIDETLRSLAFDTSTDLYDLDRLASDLPEPFVGILDRYNINIVEFAEKLRGFTGCDEDVVRSFAEEIANPTANILASVISFIVIFVGVFIVLSVLTSLLDLIFRLPILKSANMFFGFVFGCAEAAVVAFVLAILLSVLVTALGSIDPSMFGRDVVEETMICSWLLELEPVKRISELLSR